MKDINYFIKYSMKFVHGILHYKQRRHADYQTDEWEMKYRQLKEMNDIKDKIFTIITHDVRQPIANMVDFIELLEEEVDILDRDSHEIIDEVKQQMNQTYAMIDNLFDWCRYQKDGFKYSPSRENISEIVRQNIDLVQSRANKKNVKVSNRIEEEYWVYVDKEMINFVIRNLISNAIKFSYKESSIVIQAYKKGDKCMVGVQDFGIGMDAKKVKTIFRYNDCISTQGTEGEKGMGMALLLCKEFIDMNKGDIWVDSIIGKGSIFYITVPIERY